MKKYYKEFIKHFGMFLIIISVILALFSFSGWGWFLFVGVLIEY